MPQKELKYSVWWWTMYKCSNSRVQNYKCTKHKKICYRWLYSAPHVKHSSFLRVQILRELGHPLAKHWYHSIGSWPCYNSAA